MKRLVMVSMALLPLTGCMDPNSVDAQTHCLVPSMCLDLPGNHGNGPGFWGAVAAMPRYIPQQPVVVVQPMQPTQLPGSVTCTQMGAFTNCSEW
jgi:hypothetical protein